MDVAARLLHHPFYVVATFANNVGVLRVGNIHLQRHSVTLGGERDHKGTNEKLALLTLHATVALTTAFYKQTSKSAKKKNQLLQAKRALTSGCLQVVLKCIHRVHHCICCHSD